MKTLLILNDPAYGTERSYNGLRLAAALAKRDDSDVRVFLIGDAVGCAMANQKVPDGYYHLDRMILSAPGTAPRSAAAASAWTPAASTTTTSPRAPGAPASTSSPSGPPGPTRSSRSSEEVPGMADRVVVELGDSRAAFATGDFYAADAPEIRLRRPGRHWHLAKVAFEKYWLRRWA